MATAKSAKVQAEIDKAKVKLAEQQSRIRELEAKRTELENMEIVDIVRGMSIPLDNLANMLQSIRNGSISVPTLTSGQLGSKSEKQIEKENEN